MRRKRLSVVLGMALAILIADAARATAQEQVLHSFGGLPKNSVGPIAQLVFDASGNLYGMAQLGGIDNVGTVFELTPSLNGGWNEKLLHSFAKNGADGEIPGGGPLIFDAAGNLYGTTEEGGTDGVGTVFELSPPVPPSSHWTEKILHSFLTNGVDGQDPVVGVVMDSAGNLYGTTLSGGKGAAGTVFELTPGSGGSWTESLLHSFEGKDDGNFGRGSLIFDSAGNLYGTTEAGGSNSGGTVFELSPSAGGTWSETVLYNFSSYKADAWFPTGGVTFDFAGNLYGVTAAGGRGLGGTVFQLTPSETGSWNEKILYAFDYENKSDGTGPIGNLTFDSAGNLYGTTFSGGSETCIAGCGIVFELKPTDGSWIERMLHNFVDNGIDGYSPGAGVILDSVGNLYGVTPYGGAFGGPNDDTNGGTVFEVRH
jgi:uncharacterized repeat protein (TIGR03803 family)